MKKNLLAVLSSLVVFAFQAYAEGENLKVFICGAGQESGS